MAASVHVPDDAQARARREALVRQLLSVSRVVEVRISVVLAKLSLTPSMAAALWSARPEGTPLSELSTLLGCDRSNATLISERLESAGLAQRVIDPDDRRVRVLTLTSAGRRARAELIASIGVASGLDRLTAREHAQLAGLLTKMGLHG